MSISQTVADSKRRFYNAYPRVIPGLYRRVVDELLVELHLLSCQQGFQADALFALGLTQVFDNFSVGFEPVDRREQLFSALCEAADLSAPDLRQQAQQLRSSLAPHGEAEIRQWLENKGDGAPAVLGSVLQEAGRSDFHYSRHHAVGLIAALQELAGADDQDPEALRLRAREVGDLIGLQQEKLEKDMGLYASNLEKMAQAVQMMEETVAAERRRRERKLHPEAVQGAAGEAPGPTAGLEAEIESQESKPLT